MKANSNYRYLILSLLLSTLFSSLSFFNFNHFQKSTLSFFFTLLSLILKERFSAIYLRVSTTTVLFNYKKRVHPLFVFEKDSMSADKNYFSNKYQI